MKHGDKGKAKAAKAKASGNKVVSKEVGAKSKAASAKHSAKGKAGQVLPVKATGKVVPPKVVAKAAGAKVSAGKADDGKVARSTNGNEAGTFTNPLVGAGFKRALKKFPTAFKRLTD